MRLKSFPTGVGSSWTYEWEDRWSNKIDTVVVRVTARLDSTAAGPVTIWVFEHAYGPDTLFMLETGDTIRFLYWLDTASWSDTYLFPLRVGAVWKKYPLTDSCWVSAQEAVSVPAGRYSGAFRVEDTWGYLNAYGVVSTWFVPDVGIVIEDHWELNLGPGPNYVRRLLEYEIVEDGAVPIDR